MVKLRNSLIILLFIIVSCNNTPVEVEVQDTINYFYIDTVGIDMNEIVNGNTKREIYFAHKIFVKEYEEGNMPLELAIKKCYKQIKHGD